MNAGGISEVGIRRSYVVLAVALGIAIIAVAWFLSDWLFPETFWSGVLVNVGTTIMLAGFIFWLERRFVRTARSAVRQAASEAASVAAVEVERRTVDLVARIDSLQEQIEKRRAEAAAEEDEVLKGLEQTMSWRAVWDAMAAASGTGAIAGQVSVLAGVNEDAPMIDVTVRDAMSDWNQQWSEALFLMMEPPPQDDGSRRTFGPQIEWVEGTGPAEVIIELEQEMVRQGYGKLLRTLDVTSFVENLRIGLSDAMDGRRALDGAWRSAADLYRILGPDWVVSSAGVEERHHGIVIPRSEFLAFFENWEQDAKFAPTCPDWTEPTWWAFVIQQAFHHRWDTTHGF